MEQITDSEARRDLARRSELTQAIAVTIFVVSLMLVPIVLMIGRYSALVILIPFLTLVSLTFVILKVTKAPIIAGNWLVFQIYWAISVAIYRRQGEITVFDAWFILVPILGTMLGRKKSGLIWAGLAAGTVIAIEILRMSGHTFLFPVETGPRSGPFAVSIVLILIGLAVTASLIYERYNDLSMDFIRSLMLKDELTKLHNRRGFLFLADRQMKQAKRDGKIFSLIFIDLDHFKLINDAYGHAAGDEALVTTAHILNTSLRETDMTARLGGDEFVIAANVKERTEVDLLLDRVDEEFQKFKERKMRPYDIRFSYGVVFKDPDETVTLEALMKRSDALMYEAKRRKKGYEAAA